MQLFRRHPPIRPLIAMLTGLGLAACLLLWLQARTVAADSGEEAAVPSPTVLEPLFSVLDDYRQSLDGGQSASFATALAALQAEQPGRLDDAVISALRADDARFALLAARYREAREQVAQTASQRQFLAERIREEGWKIEQLGRQLGQPPSLARDAARLAVYLGQILDSRDRATMTVLVTDHVRPLLDDISRAVAAVSTETAAQLRSEIGKLRRQLVEGDGFARAVMASRQAREAASTLESELSALLQAMSSRLLRLPKQGVPEPGVASVWWLSGGFAALLLSIAIAALGIVALRTRPPEVAEVRTAVQHLAPVAPAAPPHSSFFDEARKSVRALHELYRGLCGMIDALAERSRAGAADNGPAAEKAEPARAGCAEPLRRHAERIGGVIRKQLGQVEAVNASCQQVNDAISEVEEIAFEINLLALNAAVEAAHAGELGNGFAIVAAEVRELAQRSTRSATDIRELITESIAQVHEIRRLVEDSIREVETLAERTAEVQPHPRQLDAERAAPAGEAVLPASELDSMRQLAAELDWHSRRLRDLIRAEMNGENAPNPPAEMRQHRKIA